MTSLLLRHEQGQTMAEYSVVLAVVTLLVIGSLTLLSTNLSGHITRIAGYIFQ
jgi:Flp pilus assembly pilin Flp